jgi:hypothetical protein
MGKIVKILLIVGGIFVALGACAVLIYWLINQTLFGNIPVVEKTPTATPTINVYNTPIPGVTDTVSPTESVVVAPPSGWVLIDNTVQKYLAYRPNGWYYRLFAPNMETLGIDTNKIPEASEWAGIITMSRLSAGGLESYKSNLEVGYTSAVQTISGRSWTLIEGKTPANELFNAQFVKYAFVTVDGKDYVAGIRSDLANYGGQEGTFDTFVSVISFY